MQRRAATLISVLVVVAVAVPGLLPRDRDSFPLSFYPMYAADRPAVVDVSTVVGRNDDGARFRLSMHEIANTDDPLITAALVRDSIAGGDSDILCEEIAGRVRSAGTIEVVTERHDLIAFVTDSELPLEVVVHSSCEVGP